MRGHRITSLYASESEGLFSNPERDVTESFPDATYAHLVRLFLLYDGRHQEQNPCVLSTKIRRPGNGLLPVMAGLVQLVPAIHALLYLLSRGAARAGVDASASLFCNRTDGLHPPDKEELLVTSTPRTYGLKLIKSFAAVTGPE